MSAPEALDDVMSRLAGLSGGSAAANARALRPDVIRFTGTSDAAVFRPASDGGLTRAERAAAALRIAHLLDDAALAAHYRALLAPLDPGGKLAAGATGQAPIADDRWSCIIAHVDRVSQAPGSSEAEHIARLGAAGLMPQAIVALSQLIAYVSFQSRVRATLAALAGQPPATAGAAAVLPATKPMRDFTEGELEWKPWLTPVDLDSATPAQREALKITPSNRAVGAYALVLANDPDTVKERSPLYNAIMFGPKGLPRADRELGAVVASRINGCAYCASVHAKRFIELAKETEPMVRLHRDGTAAALDPRRSAMVAFAAKLTAAPARLGPADLEPLRKAGLADGDILDLAHAVAMFAWANRLMQSLGASA